MEKPIWTTDDIRKLLRPYPVINACLQNVGKRQLTVEEYCGMDLVIEPADPVGACVCVTLKTNDPTARRVHATLWCGPDTGLAAISTHSRLS